MLAVVIAPVLALVVVLLIVLAVAVVLRGRASRSLGVVASVLATVVDRRRRIRQLGQSRSQLADRLPRLLGLGLHALSTESAAEYAGGLRNGAGGSIALVATYRSMP